jgi:alpha-tubulin suppressor-like RCC1 family protein
MLRSVASILISLVTLGLGAVTSEAADYACTNCFSEVSAGESHTCAIREDGSVTCWGYDFFDQATPPELDLGLYDFVQVSSGGYHTCAVVECTPGPGEICPLGNGLCWGNDDDGQASPLAWSDFSQISAGRYHSCGLEVDNDLVCWGSNDSGQITVPTLGTNSQYLSVSAGGYHSCALIGCLPGYACFWSNNVVCWGSGGWGQTNDAGVSGILSQVSAGWYHTCGLTQDGSAVCWGRDDDDQSTPPSGVSFQQISAGGFHTCGLTVGGTIECWGRNDFKQSVPPGGLFTSVSTGAFHSCAVTPDGSVSCWGATGHNRRIPPAGLCGLFEADFEVGGDCRWSNGGTPCWTLDCDNDGFVSERSASICDPVMPTDIGPGCPNGAWIDLAAACGTYDCMDQNPLVFSGQDDWFPVAYTPWGGEVADRFDFNCDGVEEKQFRDLNTNICCATDGGRCQADTGKGCDPPGWDSATVSDVPGCGEIADFRSCEMVNSSCIEVVEPRVQHCR